MHKLNLFGEDTSRLVGALYGHNGSGKVYNYLGKETLRTGDLVTPEVTHAVSGKTYKTLGRIVYTRDAEGTAAEQTIDKLSADGVELKTIGSTDQRSLPGYYPGWGEDTMHKLNTFGE